MSEIPEDIILSAREAVKGLDRNLDQRGVERDTSSIAKAIWAERQRNAKIAEDEEGPSGDQFEQGWNSACFRISQAIINQIEE